MRKPRPISLRLSLGSAFVGIVLLTALCLGLATYFNMHALIRHDIRVRIEDLAATAASQIDSKMHNTIQTTADEKGPQYAAIKEELRRIRDLSTGVRFAYTMRKTAAGTVVFVVDAEDSPTEISHVGDPYEQPSPAMLAAFEKPANPQAEEAFYADKWGNWLSGYAPILAPDGSIVGIVGLDISAQKILEYEHQHLLVIGIASIGITLIVIALGLLFSRSLSKPLLLLARDLGNLRHFDLDTTVQIRSNVIEILDMKAAVDNAKNGLRSFKKYVPADLVAQLIHLGKEAVLEAEQAEVTVFFSDIKDFTQIAEVLEPEAVAENLRWYFEGMTKALLGHHATIDKYIGDAIMAFWGAPLPRQNHAAMACQAALQCQKYLAAMNQKRRAQSLAELKTRIGLHTGEVIVGNFGYEDRLNYTVMGDTVNLASRLENLNKYYGTEILISEATLARVVNSFETRRLDRVAVKGRAQDIAVHELVAEKGALSAAEKELLDLFNSGSDLYFNRQWPEALAIFENVLRHRPDDLPSRIMLQRCQEYQQTPPPEDWTGVVVMQEK